MAEGSSVMEETIDISGNADISGNNATAEYSSGGGVWSGGMFNMSGGTINENTAESGGGVIVICDTFTMSGGTINENIAESGSGVFVAGKLHDVWGSYLRQHCIALWIRGVQSQCVPDLRFGIDRPGKQCLSE